jgi:hypothetical protein
MDYVVSISLRALQQGSQPGTVLLDYNNTLGATLDLASLGSAPLLLNECTSLEVLAVDILDPDGDIFAVGGMHVPSVGAYQPTISGPQCQFQHPEQAKSTKLELVRAFDQCTAPVYTTGPGAGGVLACAPPVASSVGGWDWHATKGRGSVQFKVQVNRGGANGLGTNGENPSQNVGDVVIAVKVQGILDGSAFANGTGTVSMIWRFTLADRERGDMTMINFPLSLPITIFNGKASVKSSVDTLLNNLGLHDLPGCTTAQLLRLEIRDDNTGNAFAVPGLRTS